MFNRFTEKARKAIVYAKEEARRLSHEYIDTEHLLLGLLRGHDEVVNTIFNSFNADPERIRRELEDLISEGVHSRKSNETAFTPRAKKVLELGSSEAQSFSVAYIGSEHILLGLLLEEDGIAFQVLDNFKIDANELRDTIGQLYGGTTHPLVNAVAEEKNDAMVNPIVSVYSTKLEELQNRLVDLEKRVARLEEK